MRPVDDAVPSIATTIRQIFNRQILFEAVCIWCITDGMRPRIRRADLHSAREPVIPVHEHGVVRSDSADVLQRDVPKARIETSRAKYRASIRKKPDGVDQIHVPEIHLVASTGVHVSEHEG